MKPLGWDNDVNPVLRRKSRGMYFLMKKMPGI